MSLQKKEIDLLDEIARASITVISHDAGGANVLEAFIRANNISVSDFLVSGPAAEIFNHEKKQASRNNPPKQNIFLASTGWQTDFEISQIHTAITKNERVIVFLDHWSNFEQRLKLNSEDVHVREIVTFDEKAKSLATSAFRESEVFCFTNYYLDEQSRGISELRLKKPQYNYDFLFIGEPIRGKNYSEEDAFRYFVSKIRESWNKHPTVAIRPHPSQPREKYLTLAATFTDISIEVTEGTSLQIDLSDSKYVVGCTSMALELARMSGITVYSAVPESEEDPTQVTPLSKWKP